MAKMVRWFALILMAMLALSAQDNEIQNAQTPKKMYRKESEEIKLQQKLRRNAIAIESTNFKSYNFRLNKSSEFVIRPEAEQEVKVVFDTYWDQKNVYLQAAVLAGEEITISIEDQKRKVIYQEVFYTTAGVAFKANAGMSYRVVIKQKGTYKKIVMMHLSETVITSNRTAKRDSMAKILSKLLVAKIKLENGLKSAETELVVENKISKQILRQSENYALFEIVEAIFIAAVAFLEVKLVTNLLKNDSII